MADFISQEAVLELIDNAPIIAGNENETLISAPELSDNVYCSPPADVIARDCYDRILAENDTMRKQLAQIGKKPCDKMDDVRPVVEAHWIYHEDDYGDYYECSNCHDEYVVYESDMCWKHCPNCGAEMVPDKTDQRGCEKEENVVVYGTSLFLSCSERISILFHIFSMLQYSRNIPP